VLNNESLFTLKGKTALVTGATQGIGLATTILLGKAGAKVAFCSRNPSNLKSAEAHLRDHGISFLAIQADVTHPEAARTVIKQAAEFGSGLDILVNNAGGLISTGRFSELSDYDWENAWNFNFLSVVRFCREAIPYLKQSDSPRIINVSSVVARQPGAYNPHYSTAKMALIALTKHLSQVLSEDGILVNCVVPGIVHTEGWDRYIRDKAAHENRPIDEVSERENQRAAGSAPIGRLGQMHEVASTILFLASPSASFITGAEILVDGGKSKGV